MDGGWQRRGSIARGAQGASQEGADLLTRPPLRVRLRHEPADVVDGYATVELSPLNGRDALATFLRVTTPDLTNVLVDARRSFALRGGRVPRPIAALLERQGISKSLPVDDWTLRELVRSAGDRRVTLARIDGPADAGDARALEEALRGGTPPLDADLRAAAILQTGAGRHVWAQFRDTATARVFVSETIALHVASWLGLPACDVPAPLRPALLGLPREGCTIRPRDVRIEDGSVLVPVRGGQSRVATRLILDRATRLWGVA